VEDHKQGEGGDATGRLVEAARVNEDRGQVDQAGDAGPGGVESKPVQHDPVGDSQPEEGLATCKVGGVVRDVSCHEDTHHDVGDDDQHKANVRHDGHVLVNPGSEGKMDA
jgi:hypothetical protein